MSPPSLSKSTIFRLRRKFPFIPVPQRIRLLDMPLTGDTKHVNCIFRVAKKVERKFLRSLMSEETKRKVSIEFSLLCEKHFSLARERKWEIPLAPFLPEKTPIFRREKAFFLILAQRLADKSKSSVSFRGKFKQRGSMWKALFLRFSR